jgi:pimeloyl-ACP methyl ester carboxylesterase
MIQPLFEHRTTLAGYETRVLELEGDGPPVVFFHGYADSADTWRQALAILARRGRRAIALDLPGFGAADLLRPGLILPQFDEFAVAAVRYLAGRRRRPVLVAGNSLGGCVALRLAERSSDRLAGVVAVAPAGFEMRRMLYLMEHDPVLHSLLAVPAPVPGLVMQAAVARLYRQLAFSSSSKVDPRVVSTFTRHLRRRSVAARYLETGHRMLPELREPFTQLEQIGCPVLVVWGDRDRLVSRNGAKRILSAVPNSRLVLLETVGHCPQVEAPDRFAQLLLEFSGDAADAVVAA